MIGKILRGISVLLIILGACICMYPQASLMYGKYLRNKAIQEFVKDTEDYRDRKTYKQQQTPEPRKEDTLLDELLVRLQVYNQQIHEDNQAQLTDAFSYEDSIIDLTKYGLEDNILATLWIPRMDVELPVYVGATRENLRKGAAILGQTSMPLGGENTNTVIAAHRGGGSTPMFRNIQLLQIGDKIELTTPYQTLIYRVSEIKVILPTDTNEILIREGDDLLTLITCHPYTKNTHRYLVRAKRSLEESKSRQEDLQEAEESRNDENQELEVVQDELMDAAGIHYSETQILLEKYGTLVGIGILLYIVISGIISCIKTRKER